MRVGGKFSESFAVEVGVRQGCMMSPWMFNILMDGCMREMKCKVVNAGANSIQLISMPAPRSSHQGMPMAEELPSLYPDTPSLPAQGFSRILHPSL